jgi:hypothetical protein
MDQLLLAYENGAVGTFIRESVWGYPIVLSCHAVGMATVLGVALMLCMRVLGFAKGISVTAFDKLFAVGWIGFIINLGSGIVLFAGTSSLYFYQWTFQLKLGAILAGGILLKLVMNSVRANNSDSKQKLLAAACMTCWLVGVVTGRLMAYITA